MNASFGKDSHVFDPMWGKSRRGWLHKSWGAGEADDGWASSLPLCNNRTWIDIDEVGDPLKIKDMGGLDPLSGRKEGRTT